MKQENKTEIEKLKDKDIEFMSREELIVFCENYIDDDLDIDSLDSLNKEELIELAIDIINYTKEYLKED